MNKEDKQDDHSSEDKQSQWHISKKQKQLQNVYPTNFSQSSASQVDSNQVKQSKRRNNNQSKNEKGGRGEQNQVKYQYVRKQATQQMSQHGNQQDSKEVNRLQSRQTAQKTSKKINQQETTNNLQNVHNQSYQYSSSQWDQPIPKQKYQRVPLQNNQRQQQQEVQFVPKNEEFKKQGTKDQQEKRNEEKKSRTKRELIQKNQQLSNEWKSDPNSYLPDNFYQNEDQYYNETENNKYKGKKGQIQKVLMIAEKPQIAKKIASALSDKKSDKRQGLSKFSPVYEYEGKFKGQKTLFKVTSVLGHVYHVDFPKKYQNWNQFNPVKLFSTKAERIEEDPKKKIVKHLEKEARDCSYLLLWLDNDKEGENICFEVQSICEKVMCFEGPNTKQIMRSKFSSLTKRDLIESYHNISDLPNMEQSKAVDARRIIDLKIGVVFTRYQSLYFRNKYPSLSHKTISFGPCQTPTLGFCVEREDEIKKFTPSLTHKVKLTLMDGSNKTQVIAYCDQQDIHTENDAISICEEIKLKKQINVKSVSSKIMKKSRPAGLNTVEMLKVGSSQLNMSPQETLDVAEQLYLKGFITYPRTESTAYSESFDFEKILKSLNQDKMYGTFARQLIGSKLDIPEQGEDKGDHPPITPTQNYPKPENKIINQSEQKLYDYISTHFIASLSQDCEYKKIEIKYHISHYSFITEGIQVINQGFTKVIKETLLNENILQSNPKKDSQLQIISADVEQELTTPPHYLSESELVNLMEKNFIGTDASIAKHIQNIVERKYVEIDKVSRTLKPTQLGRSLINGYKQIDEELVKPEIRGKIERSVDQIASGKKQFSEVINESLHLFYQKYLKFVKNIHEIDSLVNQFYKTYQQLLQEAPSLSRCGLCNNKMKFIEEAEKIVCQECDIKLFMPLKGKLEVTDEKTCPKDGYQLLLNTSLNSTNDSFEFCPKCYSDLYQNSGKKRLL